MLTLLFYINLILTFTSRFLYLPLRWNASDLIKILLICSLFGYLSGRFISRPGERFAQTSWQPLPPLPFCTKHAAYCVLCDAEYRLNCRISYHFTVRIQIYFHLRPKGCMTILVATFKKLEKRSASMCAEFKTKSKKFGQQERNSFVLLIKVCLSLHHMFVQIFCTEI